MDAWQKWGWVWQGALPLGGGGGWGSSGGLWKWKWRIWEWKCQIDIWGLPQYQHHNHHHNHPLHIQYHQHHWYHHIYQYQDIMIIIKLVVSTSAISPLTFRLKVPMHAHAIIFCFSLFKKVYVAAVWLLRLNHHYIYIVYYTKVHIISDIILNIGDSNPKTTDFLNRCFWKPSHVMVKPSIAGNFWEANPLNTLAIDQRPFASCFKLNIQHLSPLLLCKRHRSQQWFLVGEIFAHAAILIFWFTRHYRSHVWEHWFAEVDGCDDKGGWGGVHECEWQWLKMNDNGWNGENEKGWMKMKKRFNE